MVCHHSLHCIRTNVDSTYEVYKPKDVKSPRSSVKRIKPLYDGGCEGFSIAILENLNGECNVGMSWNINENEWEDRLKIKEEKYCVGMPQSRGCSVWFILPKSSWKYVPQMIKDEIDGNNSPNQLDISESQIQEEINNLINSTICNE